ncbi:hypothetical protein N6G95_09525 [Pediococcus inopinatus]|uniref:hypothetical protein n=1 Tax=Pediococcus inopinatus TaxID=114090 RepID=UPI002B259926|nr:hypothetical protein [Pediococcus inopinatus]WPC19443.1 hypothetical protein N6G95_09525 [Pediococcus inopinatus]
MWISKHDLWNRIDYLEERMSHFENIRYDGQFVEAYIHKKDPYLPSQIPYFSLENEKPIVAKFEWNEAGGHLTDCRDKWISTVDYSIKITKEADK